MLSEVLMNWIQGLKKNFKVDFSGHVLGRFSIQCLTLLQDWSAYDYLNSIYFVKQITSLNEYMPMSLSADVVGIL